MQEREAKTLCKSGDMELAIVSPSSDKKGWSVRFVDKQSRPHDLVSKRMDTPRVFKTSDAALRCCLRIGFRQVEVHM